MTVSCAVVPDPLVSTVIGLSELPMSPSVVTSVTPAEEMSGTVAVASRASAIVAAVMVTMPPALTEPMPSAPVFSATLTSLPALATSGEAPVSS